MWSNCQGQRKGGEEGQVGGNGAWVNQQPKTLLHWELTLFIYGCHHFFRTLLRTKADKGRTEEVAGREMFQSPGRENKITSQFWTLWFGLWRLVLVSLRLIHLAQRIKLRSVEEPCLLCTPSSLRFLEKIQPLLWKIILQPLKQP